VCERARRDSLDFVTLRVTVQTGRRASPGRPSASSTIRARSGADPRARGRAGRAVRGETTGTWAP